MITNRERPEPMKIYSSIEIDKITNDIMTIRSNQLKNGFTSNRGKSINNQ